MKTLRAVVAAVIVLAMVAGAAEEGPRMVLAVSAGALMFAAGLLFRRPWVSWVLGAVTVAILHPAGPLPGLGAGLFISLLLWGVTRLAR